MQFASIASGSSGNCLFAGNDDTHILIDAGISKKRIEEGLASFGVEGRHIDAILVTHEHTDHIQGIGVWSRKYHIPIYGTRGTLSEIARSSTVGNVDEKLFRPIRPGERFQIGSMTVNPFTMPHDAKDPCCYRVSDRQHSVGMATDLGYFDQRIVEALTGCDLLYIEANHDLRMLEVGPYPYHLKQRIAGNYGHLSNESSGHLIGNLLNEKLQAIVLGHLSKENNYPELAYETVKAELLMNYRIAEKDLNLSVAPRSCAMELVKL